MIAKTPFQIFCSAFWFNSSLPHASKIIATPLEDKKMKQPQTPPIRF
jgi:hypothetical protein